MLVLKNIISKSISLWNPHFNLHNIRESITVTPYRRSHYRGCIMNADLQVCAFALTGSGSEVVQTIVVYSIISVIKLCNDVILFILSNDIKVMSEQLARYI